MCRRQQAEITRRSATPCVQKLISLKKIMKRSHSMKFFVFSLYILRVHPSWMFVEDYQIVMAKIIRSFITLDKLRSIDDRDAVHSVQLERLSFSIQIKIEQKFTYFVQQREREYE
jgi:hypothetical protein